MATEVRQIKRLQLSDWFTATYAKCSDAEHQLSASGDVHQETKFLCNETDSQTKWDQYSTDVRLADHVSHMRQWVENLERILGQLDQEIADLSDAKEMCENLMDFITVRTDVAIECLTLREGRRSTEVVIDEPDDQLHKEVELIDRVKKTLTQRISDSFEQVCLLQEARHQLQANLQDKISALAIDIEQYNLSNMAPSISYKLDALQTPKGSTTYKQWDDFSCCIRDKAEAEIKSSRNLREQINHTVHQSANDFEAQSQATEYAFRKRMYESQRAKDEMEWLKKNTEDTIADLENDIRGIEESLRSKHQSIKKAQTRLENRSYRSNAERCCDAVHHGLIDETKQLCATINALEEKLKQAQHTLDGLKKSLKHLTDDIALKSQTMHLDTQCLGIRQKLNLPANLKPENRN